jgi:Uma2 family endonuclease
LVVVGCCSGGVLQRVDGGVFGRVEVRYRGDVAISATQLPAGPFTYDDLLALPDDGHRYELFDGSLLVSAAPNRGHQRCVSRLLLLLAPYAQAAGCEVLPGPIDVRLAEDRVLEPDLIVVRAGPGSQQTIDEAPLLVVEVSSPSTRSIDRDLKRRAYEERGIPSFWLVDPLEPSLTALELEGDRYVERAHIVGEGEFQALQPFTLTVVPADLVGELGHEG